MSKSKPALGKGLNNLLGGDSTALLSELKDIQHSSTTIGELSISTIVPNPHQPRREFDEAKLEELASSIRTLGVVQPITVQEQVAGEYIIIAGERRWRAAQLIGLRSIPAYIVRRQQEQILEMALIENIQREDLNPIEVALAYRQILSEQNISQTELAERVGKSRVAVTNTLRLLELPSEIQLGLTQRLLDMGHARALLSVKDLERQLEIYNLILTEALSVRQVEDLARHMQEGNSIADPKGAVVSKVKPTLPKEYGLLEKHLAQVFSTKVSLRRSADGKGKLTIPFTSDQELEHIMTLLERIQQ